MDTSNFWPNLEPTEILAVANIFPKGRWRTYAICRYSCRIVFFFTYLLYPVMLPFRVAIFYMHRQLFGRGRWHNQRLTLLYFPLSFMVRRDRRNLPRFAASPFRQLLAQIWWTLYYLLVSDIHQFEQSYTQAWKDWMNAVHDAGNVDEVHMFVGSDQLKVPVLVNSEFPAFNLDEYNFNQLRMWYSMMVSMNGIGEILLPRRLNRIDKVNLCASTGLAVLGSRIRTFELGRRGQCHVANFEEPSRLPEAQRFQTDAMFSDTKHQGLEFVRSWDPLKVSIVSLMPFVGSIVFAMVWISVYVVRGTDVQVAVQTAFTVSSYIVTAGALLIALFAFLDTQAANDPSENAHAVSAQQMLAAIAITSANAPTTQAQNVQTLTSTPSSTSISSRP